MLWLFFHLYFHFLFVFFTLSCDYSLRKLKFYVFFTLACFEPPQVNMGYDTAEKSLDQVLARVTLYRQHLTNKITMKCLTQKQWRKYNNATNCSICVKAFMSADKKVCNHNHLTDEYWSPVHNTCNLNNCFHTVFSWTSGIIHSL